MNVSSRVKLPTAALQRGIKMNEIQMCKSISPSHCLDVLGSYPTEDVNVDTDYSPTIFCDNTA